MDTFNTLQDLQQKQHGTKPIVLSCEGHQEIGFSVVLRTAWGTFLGNGNRKKEARAAAARRALDSIDLKEPPVNLGTKMPEPGTTTTWSLVQRPESPDPSEAYQHRVSKLGDGDMQGRLRRLCEFLCVPKPKYEEAGPGRWRLIVHFGVYTEVAPDPNTAREKAARAALTEVYMHAAPVGDVSD